MDMGKTHTFHENNIPSQEQARGSWGCKVATILPYSNATNHDPCSVRVTVNPLPYPVKVGIHSGMGPQFNAGHHAHTHLFCHYLYMGQFSVVNVLSGRFLGGGGKPENLEETHPYMRRTRKYHIDGNSNSGSARITPWRWSSVETLLGGGAQLLCPG